MQSSRLTQEPVLLSIKTFPSSIDAGVFFLAVTSADGFLKRVLRFSTDENFQRGSSSSTASPLLQRSFFTTHGDVKTAPFGSKDAGYSVSLFPTLAITFFTITHHSPCASTNKGAASKEVAFFILQ